LCKQLKKFIAMGSLFKLLYQGGTMVKLVLFTASLLTSWGVSAQEKQSITGRLIDGKNNQAVSFATIALIRASDSAIYGGAMSDERGIFNISPALAGNYILRVSNIGYKPATRNIKVMNESVTDAGTIILQDTSILLKELIITGERVKARTESDRTVYNVTEKIVNASNTGTDVLKLIPGIQIDLMQNISLEGSRDILIYVDGKERNKNFVGQLDPKLIDKIEIISAPPSNYEGNLTGAINIVLKKNRDSGFSGQILAEIPTSLSVVYIFPAYSLNYGFKKMNFYTSYNGEMTYLDQQEINRREVWNNSDSTTMISTQDVKQKKWSHIFHYGLDYFLSDRDQFNFYAFYNPCSRELDGNAYSQISGLNNSYWQAKKEDTDINTSSFYSLYYKHVFSNRSEITSDISSYNLRAETGTDYIQVGTSDETGQMGNAVKPAQDMLSIKIDYSTILMKKLNFSTGIKSKFQLSRDRLTDFEYKENIFALYGNITYKHEKFDLSTGLRTEKSVVNLKDSFTNTALAFLPYANFRYRLNSKQNLQLAYNRSIRRPNLNQLNPATTFNDPYSISRGNPFLRPEFLGSIFLEHSVQFKGNYFASRLFYNRATSVINYLTYINSEGNFETRAENPGNMSQYGLQLSGSLKLSILTLNPYLKAYSLSTSGNDIAKYYSVENKTRPGLESGLSAIASFKHDLSLSLTFQYNTPGYDIQTKSFTDISYFLTLEKTFRQKIKVGIASAIPFTRTFIYQGSEVTGPDFHTYYEGNVKMTAIPVWLRLSYQFSSGKDRNKINRDKEETDNLQKKGF
jgi:Outer membrane protein beta-barrel family/CarboxypepD_reg-like domain/TonB-dependent Receptor Plug Domain